MAEEVITQGTPGEDVETETPTTVDATGQNGGGEAERKFTQADLDRFVKERLLSEKAHAEKQIRKATADAEAKALAEQGKFEELYRKAQAEAAEAQRALAETQLSLLRTQVGTQYNLPPLLIERLRGETQAEMEADAKALLAALPKPAAPNINANPGNGRAPQALAGGLTESVLREQAVRLGVDPTLYIQQFIRS